MSSSAAWLQPLARRRQRVEEDAEKDADFALALAASTAERRELREAFIRMVARLRDVAPAHAAGVATSELGGIAGAWVGSFVPADRRSIERTIIDGVRMGTAAPSPE